MTKNYLTPILVHCWWECRLMQSLWKTVLSHIKKLKIGPAIQILNICPKENKLPCLLEDICTPICVYIFSDRDRPIYVVVNGRVSFLFFFLWLNSTPLHIEEDRSAWCTSVHGVTKSWTQLSDWKYIYICGRYTVGRYLHPRTSICVCVWIFMCVHIYIYFLHLNLYTHTRVQISSNSISSTYIYTYMGVCLCLLHNKRSHCSEKPMLCT